jgi:hypothetical protein
MTLETSPHIAPILDTLAFDGYQTSVHISDGIPCLEVWREGTVMPFNEATRLAAKVQFLAGYLVSFHQLSSQGLSLFLFAPVRNYPANLYDEFGTPVSQWVAAALELHPVDTCLMDKSDAVFGGGDVDASTASGHGFLWLRRLGFDCTKRSGKWCIVRDGNTVDELWAQVRGAVKAGHIPAALVSTPSQAASHGGTHVICVFTEDWLDFAAVKGMRELLRSFGVTEDIGYKRDIDTENGVYGTPQEWAYRA